jgi:hypothetical protein
MRSFEISWYSGEISHVVNASRSGNAMTMTLSPLHCPSTMSGRSSAASSRPPYRMSTGMNAAAYLSYRTRS